MSETHRGWRLKTWQTILLFGILLCAIYAFGSFTFDYYAGAGTAEFGVWSEVGGIGMFFIYVMGFFIALVVVLPILLVRRFGVGLMVYLPYAISGIFVEYYMEWVLEQNLVALWAIAGWAAVGLVTGLSADLAYRFLPARLSERRRAITTGVVLGAVSFLTVLAALMFFYPAKPTGPGSFVGIIPWALPFLLVSSGFGGYTAYAISKEIK